MSRLRTISLLACVVLASCQLVNLNRVTAATFPGSYDAVLGQATPVWIEFSEPVEKTGAETLFKVSSPDGALKGDLSWQETRLVFTPQPAYRPGVRYVLSFNGEVRTDDGRRFTLAAAVPFFSMTSDVPGRLTAVVPADGAQTGGGSSIEFTFTKSMDTTQSSDDYFSLSPATAFVSEWDAGGTRLTVRPQGLWKPLQVYAWTIAAVLKDDAGIALAREYRGVFLAQNPAAPAPVIASLEPAVNSWAALFPPAGSALAAGGRADNWIGFQDAIRINFQVPDRPLPDDPARVDLASLEQAFSITPSVNGSLQCVKTADSRDDCFVFIPAPGERFLAKTTYHLKIDRDLKNREGAALAGDFEAWFSAAVPDIAVSRIVISNAVNNTINFPVASGLFNSYLDLDASVLAGFAPDYFTIEFNDGFSIDPAKAYDVADQVELTAVFPETGGPYEKRNVVYSAGSPPRFTVAYWGVSAADGIVYRLRLKGGPDGIVDSRGSYFPEDVFIYFIVQED